jgi:hypothetical protein
MPFPRLVSTLRRALARLVPPRFHTRRMSALLRVERLTPTQREELARNLRRMLRPKIA